MLNIIRYLREHFKLDFKWAYYVAVFGFIGICIAINILGSKSLVFVIYFSTIIFYFFSKNLQKLLRFWPLLALCLIPANRIRGVMQKYDHLVGYQ